MLNPEHCIATSETSGSVPYIVNSNAPIACLSLHSDITDAQVPAIFL